MSINEKAEQRFSRLTHQRLLAATMLSAEQTPAADLVSLAETTSIALIFSFHRPCTRVLLASSLLFPGDWECKFGSGIFRQRCRPPPSPPPSKTSFTATDGRKLLCVTPRILIRPVFGWMAGRLVGRSLARLLGGPLAWPASRSVGRWVGRLNS